MFKEIPPQNQGQYYPWFLEHQDLLDPTVEPLTQVVEVFLLESVTRAWRHIGGRLFPNNSASNDIKIEKETWPSINVTELL